MKKRSAYLVVKRVSIVVGSASILAIGVSLFQLTKGAGASSSPFQGVAAAQNAAAGGLNATALTELQGLQANAGGDIRGQVVSNARQLTSNVVGHPAFMIPTEAGDFCIFVEQVGESCMTPLSSSNPVLFTVTDRDGPSGVGPTAWGIASDGSFPSRSPRRGRREPCRSTATCLLTLERLRIPLQTSLTSLPTLQTGIPCPRTKPGVRAPEGLSHEGMAPPASRKAERQFGEPQQLVRDR